MPIQREEVRFGRDRDFSGLALTPPHPDSVRPLPSVVLIQEVWGVDGHIADVAHRLAAAGYAVLAPDLYAAGGKRLPGHEPEPIAEAKAWLDTQAPGVWMDPELRGRALRAEEPGKAARVEATLGVLFGGLQPGWERFLEVVGAAAGWLRDEGAASRGGRVGAMGFCMGGALAAGLALRDRRLAAAVVCYGQAPDPGEAASVACPILGLYGENDPRTNASVGPFEAAMKAAGKECEVRFLKGAGHAFLNDTRSSFHAGAAREAWPLALGFLVRHLG